MKRIIADVYKIAFRISGYKVFSLVFALIFIGIVHLVLIYGFALLLNEWYPFMSFVLKAFRFPFSIGLLAIAIFINYRLMLPLSNLSKERGKVKHYMPVILYTLLAVIICAYVHYKDQIF